MESDDRGRKAEDVVGQVLAMMEKEGLVVGSYRNKQHGEVDELGMDFLVYLRNGLILPVQVKAASKDNENRRCKHLKKHPHVPFLIFVDLELYKVRPEKVMNSILEELKGFLRTR